MNIRTQAQDFDLTRALDEFVRKQLTDALQRLDEDIIDIEVIVKDTNGPKGGVDKQAVIRVRLRSRQRIALVTTHENLYAAIRKGVKRTKRAVRRQLRKSRHITRRPIRDLLDDKRLGTASKA